jgi:UDP-2,3-diacylglucosamine hydrolase
MIEAITACPSSDSVCKDEDSVRADKKSRNYEAVFISDLHLHPRQLDIQARFNHFVQWAAKNTQSLYILGDFFHVWAGDDAIDDWGLSVAAQLSWLHRQGVSIYYLHGNRDFLLGQCFAKQAEINILPDPTVIVLNGERVLLTHGDQYCTNDRAHQWLRRLTRNRLFIRLFLNFPLRLRNQWVAAVREYSQGNKQKGQQVMGIVPAAMIAQMQRDKTRVVIHGHIHQPGLTCHTHRGQTFQQYVLSDWDDSPQILCYDTITSSINFTQI